MKVTGIDFETYYDDEYTLRRMTSEEYIRDPRFELIMVGISYDTNHSEWFSGTLQEIRDFLVARGVEDSIAVGHNLSEFDSLIMTEKLNFRPKYWQCTLSIARALGDGRSSQSLASLARRYGMPDKGDAVIMAKGKRRADFSPQELDAYGEYCAHDAWLTREIYQQQIKGLPTIERMVLHWFIRMFAEPRLEVDGGLVTILAHYHAQLRQRLLRQVATDVGIHTITGEVDYEGVRRKLRSDPQFAALLRSYGVTPGMKLSERKSATAGKPVYSYAFAKTDSFMEQLLLDPDPRVSTAAEARVGVKSSIMESRLERFKGIASRGKLPAPFAYGKTHTHRAAGAGKINLQNMGRPGYVDDDTPRGAPVMVGDDLFQLVGRVDDRLLQLKDQAGQVHEVPRSKARVVGLRDCIMAPKGKRVVVVDSGAIELRVAHALAGQMDTVEKLVAGVQLYEEFATELYGYEVNKFDHPKERNHGKIAMLQLQYQAGHGSFQNQARVMGGVILTEEESKYTVDVFRTKFARIRAMWYRCQRMIEAMYQGREEFIDEWGLCRTGKDQIVLPGGLVIHYHGLHTQKGEYGDEWVYYDKETRKQKRLYGGVIFENLCQALARLIVFEQALLVEHAWGKALDEGVCMTAHDEVCVLVSKEKAQACLEHSLEVFKTPPSWWEWLPLDAEGSIGRRYGTATA